MYIVTGATSNTGSVVAHRLLDEGKKVRVIGRDLEKLKSFTIRGAEAFVAEPTDAAALTQAFKEAKAAWIMLQPNYIADSKDFPAYQAAVTHAIVTAIAANGLEHAVTLSSWGADRTYGTGPVLGLHNLEQALNQLASLNILHLRAGYFMENTLSYIDSIRKYEKVIGPFDQDLALPFISTADIGHAGADALINLLFSGHQVQELHGQCHLSIREAVTIIGSAIGKPDLIYEQNSVKEFGQELLAYGVSANVSALMEEVVNGINSRNLTTTQPRTKNSTTPTSFEQFVADTFVPTYNKL